MTRRDIPNLITLLRILLVPPFLFALWKGDYWVALALFLVAGASDGLDGFLAKRYDWGTRFGSILDPIADKLLLVGAFLALTWMGRIPLMARDRRPGPRRPHCTGCRCLPFLDWTLSLGSCRSQQDQYLDSNCVGAGGDHYGSYR